MVDALPLAKACSIVVNSSGISACNLYRAFVHNLLKKYNYDKVLYDFLQK